MASIDKLIQIVLIQSKFSINDIDFKIDEEGIGTIWLKRNGVFSQIPGQVFDQDDLIKFIQDILKDRNLTYPDFQKIKDIDLSYMTSIDKVPYYFRVNLFFSSGRPGIIFRYIKTEIPSFESLKFPVQFVEKFINAKDGLFLFAGSTGSGKSTSVAAMIDYYNKHRASHILTLEDPIEYRFKPIKCGFNQREIGTDCLSYENGLMSGLRQAPDIIFIGELRSFNTIDLALKLSESGHIVISTIHTKDASSVISRMLNTVPPEKLDEVRTVLASAFRGVVHQELIPTKNGGRVLAIETMYEHHTVGASIQQNQLGKLRSIISTNRDVGMITKQRYIEENIVPLNIVDALELKKHLTD